MSDISALLLLKNRRNVHDKLQFPINPGADLKKFSATVAAISQDTSRCINEVTEYVLRIKEEVASLRLVLEQFNVQLGTKIKDAFDSVLTIGIQDSNGLGLRYQLKEKNLDLKRAKHVAELQRCAKKQQDLMESINKIDGLIIRVEEEGIFSLDDIDNTNDSIIRWKIYIEKQQQMRLAEEEKRRREKEEKERKEKERKRKEDKEKIRLKEIERQRLEEEQRRQEEMLKQKQEEERRRKEEEEKQRIEEEKKRLEEEKKRQDEERQRKEEEDRRQREKEERRRMEEERKHLEEQKRQLEEERRRIEEAEKRRHEEEKRRREEEERKRIEEERRLREEEEQRRKEEEERKRQQEEERRRHEEEERKRKEEETRKRKEEEERKRIEEEKKRIEEERKRIEEERQRIEDERKRREEEERMRPIIEARRREEAKRRRDPNNWPTYVYDRPKVNDSFHNGVCCAVSAITGEQGLDRDDIECRFSDRQDDLSRALADKHEQPLSSLVSIRSKQGMQIDLEDCHFRNTKKVTVKR
ncbi:golgin subfamily A member 6-like protein 6 [Saccostrea echinata]|uniref:golgin subfamily A member 6-like protein 6 n=1 Tax=Saccostrea echinata TaxID=191078 RepID=UPI002A810A15|nr:golgin subfamily A member 6-like protein 6 [Saccostrea echinata]